MTATSQDLHYMQLALNLSERDLGRCWPNPSVGCVLVKDGHIIGRGWTQPGGRPHAETEALKQAGEATRGATAYVTLEPCAHEGRSKSGPCSEALIKAGIKRVVIAAQDPDPRTASKGIAVMRAAGIEVITGVMEAEATALNKGFFLRITQNRPLVALKIAATLDGNIATHAGESQWITSPQARCVGHRLRARYDAVVIGSGTLLSDNPKLTCRLPGMRERSPLRIVLDSRLRIEPSHALASTTDEAPVWVLTSAETLKNTPTQKKTQLEKLGIRLLTAETSGNRLTPQSILSTLAQEGLTRLLIEGGPEVATTFLQSRNVDELWWFSAPRIVGGDGLRAISPLGISALANALALKPAYSRQVGEDTLIHYQMA